MNSRISIITINRNNSAGLEKTIESVIRQTSNEIEFIIVDGGSEDDSVDVIKKHSDKLTDWISEPDNGIYNAMNKGLKKATGDYFLFLNSGDSLADDRVLQDIQPFLNGTDIVYGDLIIAEATRQWIKKYDTKPDFGYFFHDTLPHQGSFISRDIFSTVGLYDESYPICADWKFFVDAVCRHHATLTYVDRVIAVYDYNGMSSDVQNADRIAKEKYDAFEKDYSLFFHDYMELNELRKKYPPLANSRAIKSYLKLRKVVLKIFGKR